jgi:hypothetical protein
MSKIKSFKGKIADNGQDKITLHTNDGATGYRIIKFQVMTEEPYGGGSAEHLMKVYKIKQASVTATVDFSDNTLVGAAIINNSTSGYQNASNPVIIFDHEVFNQDIYITHTDNQGSQACNYYLELEVMKLDLTQNTMATLKDVRNETLAL